VSSFSIRLRGDAPPTVVVRDASMVDTQHNYRRGDGERCSLMVDESRREVDLSEPYCLQPGGSATIDVC
jgi:hypothetical protein